MGYATLLFGARLKPRAGPAASRRDARIADASGSLAFEGQIIGKAFSTVLEIMHDIHPDGRANLRYKEHKLQTTYVKTMYSHKLASQPLRDLLSMVGRPVTRAEKRILASLGRSYKRMRGAFPTKQLGNDLDALYTKAFSIVNDTEFALAALAFQYGWLAIETKEPSLAKEETLKAVFEASHELNPELAAVLTRCHELLFLALAKAANRINAALKAAKKK